MKKSRFLLLVLTVLISYSSFGQLSGKEIRKRNKELKIQEIQQLIDNKQFVFKPNSLTTNTGFYKTLNHHYDLVLKNDTATAYLPFWGTVHLARINDEGGIKFESQVEKYKYRNRGKKGHEISFEAKKDGDTYHIHFNISREGYANLTITSTRKSFISYSGKVESIQKE